MNIAIMGYGVVGGGVAELFYAHKEANERKAGKELEIKYILDLRDFLGDPFENKIIKDFSVIENDDSVKIVAECMGGLNPAYDFVKRCLQKGKSVVTSNKELVAEKGYELLTVAQQNGVNFLFEASVGGGIPIIRPISQCLAANDINEIAGILNGTTNFILTKMTAEGADFAETLKTAQELGYAERNPKADIEGDDTCRKICILSALSFGRHVYPSQVFTRGITDITPEDIACAKALGGVLKLLCVAKPLENGQISCFVSPCFVYDHSQLANVDGVFNAVLIRGDATGDVVFYGKGAGKLPTASAAVADIIDCAKHIDKKKIFGWEKDGLPGYVQNFDETEVSFLVRAAAAASVDEAKAAVAKAFEGAEFVRRKAQPKNEICFAVPVMQYGAFVQKLSQIAEIETKNKFIITDY